MICQYCKETIQDGAIKCRHCGSVLIAQPMQESPFQRSSVVINSVGAEIQKSTITWGWILASFGAAIMPLLAIGAIVIGIKAIRKGKLNNGIGMIIVSAFVASFSMSSFGQEFWIGFWKGYFGVWPSIVDSIFS